MNVFYSIYYDLNSIQIMLSDLNQLGSIRELETKIITLKYLLEYILRFQTMRGFI